MKKLFLLGALLLGTLTVQSAYSQDCCPSEGEACGECYCKFVRYEPRYYNTTRCVEERIPCQKKCYRMVPKYCEVQRCRMVPEYYTETVCTQERECYMVDDCRTCKRVICEPQCEYVPRYYWKHVCNDPCAQQAPRCGR